MLNITFVKDWFKVREDTILELVTKFKFKVIPSTHQVRTCMGDSLLIRNPKGSGEQYIEFPIWFCWVLQRTNSINVVRPTLYLKL